MDNLAPIEEMPWDIEEVQMYLPVNSDKNLVIKETKLIAYAFIKMITKGLYKQVIEKWQHRGVAERLAWVDFCAFMVTEFQRMMLEGTDPTTTQEGYSTAFTAKQTDCEYT